ncbi:unnamed protein product [Adineta steineri]|uniref:Protein CNPPD1 n=1 Tax=Adineta steineri TaxID=433720 RepID=A0A814HTK8_9BILA|nr:unnamed protein product [Adineta steineri]CAF3686035.1 unnamed protein product [Adineta steineri]
MIYREKNNDYSSSHYDDLILDDIVLSDFDESAVQLQHLLNIDCALALSVCKSRNLPSCVFVLSLLYMKRLRSLPSSLTLSKIDNLTTKELYLIATLLANKYFVDEGEDEQLFNSDLMELTGISTERINLIERQVLVALDWNLYISNDEFTQFFTLFKCQIARKLNKNIDKIEHDDPMKFYNLCFQFLPQIIEYLALTSLVLLGSTLSILTAIHMSTLTHSTLMKTLNPTTNCSYSSLCYWNDHQRTNTSHNTQNHYFNFDKLSSNAQTDFTNETTDKFQSLMTLFHPPSCSYNILQPDLLSRPLVQTFVSFDNSLVNTTWFWPILGVCVALLISVPCILIAIVIFCHKKNNSGDSDESSINSSLSSSIHVHRRPACNHSRLQRSHYAGGFRSPPPPYTANEISDHSFIASSLPPPYESHVMENPSIPVTMNPVTTTNNIESPESIVNQSLTLTNPSIQTFQV